MCREQGYLDVVSFDSVAEDTSSINPPRKRECAIIIIVLKKSGSRCTHARLVGVVAVSFLLFRIVLRYLMVPECLIEDQDRLLQVFAYGLSLFFFTDRQKVNEGLFHKKLSCLMCNSAL